MDIDHWYNHRLAETRARHRARIKSKCKFKLRDRFHGKWYRTETDYRFNRQKSAPITGFGVAYEKRPAKDFCR